MGGRRASVLPATLCIHAPLFPHCLFRQIGEWEVESPVPGCLGHQEHVLPPTAGKRLFLINTLWLNALFFWFVVF